MRISDWSSDVCSSDLQAALKRGAGDLDPLGQHEAALELTGSDAAVQIDPALIVGLLAADHQLAVLDLDREVCLREAGHREGDAQPVLAALLDVVGRIALGGLGNTVDGLLELLETEQERAEIGRAHV